MQKRKNENLKTENSRYNRPSAKSSYDYMDPKKTFFFLDHANVETKRTSSRDDFRENTTLFELE